MVVIQPFLEIMINDERLKVVRCKEAVMKEVFLSDFACNLALFCFSNNTSMDSPAPAWVSASIVGVSRKGSSFGAKAI
jgi:hypothetical protein